MGVRIRVNNASARRVSNVVFMNDSSLGLSDVCEFDGARFVTGLMPIMELG
jgi:hypothetical protein